MSAGHAVLSLRKRSQDISISRVIFSFPEFLLLITVENRHSRVSKLFASIYDYINSCDIGQLDAIIVAMVFFAGGCGVLAWIYVASFIHGFFGHTKPEAPKVLVGAPANSPLKHSNSLAAPYGFYARFPATASVPYQGEHISGDYSVHFGNPRNSSRATANFNGQAAAANHELE